MAVTAAAGCAMLLSAGCRLTEDHMADTTPRGCAECHADIARQWATSAHAQAWTDPAFVDETLGRTLHDCLPCHAPEPLLEQPPGAAPALRTTYRDCGVDCNTCHRVGCAYAGRYRTFGAHPVRQDLTRLPCPTFCGTCHETEQAEYDSRYVPSPTSPQEAKTCAECHMPTARSRLTQGHLLSYIHPKRPVHDHAFPTWTEEALRGAVELSGMAVEQAGDAQVGVRFTLTNRGAGHRIPTGKFGHRELRILVEVTDPAGRPLGADEKSLLAAESEGLLPGRPTPFAFRVTVADAAAPLRVHVLVERVNEDQSFRRTLAEARWAGR